MIQVHHVNMVNCKVILLMDTMWDILGRIVIWAGIPWTELSLVYSPTVKCRSLRLPERGNILVSSYIFEINFNAAIASDILTVAVT